MTKTILRLIVSGALLVTTAIAVLAANCFGAFFFSFYPAVSRFVTGILAGVTSVVPFALCEIVLAALILAVLISLVRAIGKKHMVRWLTGVLLTACILLTAFVGVWGLNYYAPSMRGRLGLSDRQFTVEELKEATIYYRDRANELADSVERGENGVMVEYDFNELAAAAGDGYRTLSQSIDDFSGSTARVKYLLTGDLQGKIGSTGVFICLTGESCVSTTTHSASMPFTMCHEIGHRMAFAREDEANFAGFLACAANVRPEFRYSGYYAAFRYCYSALYAQDPNAAAEVWSGVSAAVARDWADAVEHYRALRNEKAAEISDTAYDAYLKSFSVKTGVQSYGEVTDLLLVWYYERMI